MAKRTDWSQEILVNGELTTLQGFLRDNYPSRSDQEISQILRQNGFEVSKTAVEHKRSRMGWKKTSGLSTTTDKPVMPAEDVELVRVEQQSDDGSPAEGQLTADQARLLQTIRDKPVSLRELSREFDRSEDTMRAMVDTLIEANYNIVEVEGRALLDTKSAPRRTGKMPQTLADLEGMTVKMLWISDLHAGSTAQQITNLRRFIDDHHEKGWRHALVSGDLFAGHQVYRGQIHDLFAIGAIKQLVVLDYTLPKLDGLTYYVIGGNHDYSFIKSSGFDIVSEFARRREDVVYMGYDLADVAVTDRVDVRLWHPSGGVPYAVSYRLQKGIEQMAFDELSKAIETETNTKLRGVSGGHLHVSMTMWRGPIFGLQAGCFEGQTNYLKRKSLFPQIGGYAIEWRITDGGLIQECTPKFSPFLEIVDDYKNYPDLLAKLADEGKRPQVEPLFSWQPDEENSIE